MQRVAFVGAVVASLFVGCALHSKGGAGSGGVGGAGSGGVGGAGSGGVGGVDCPPLAPLEGSACDGVGQCVAAGSGLPGCRTVWECFENRWVLVFDAGCVGPSLDRCPPTAEEVDGSECLPFACVYADATICACEQPCSGVQPDPDLLRTECLPAPRASCVLPKERGQACTALGETCSPACCGTMWTCTANGWMDAEIFCPP